MPSRRPGVPRAINPQPAITSYPSGKSDTRHPSGSVWRHQFTDAATHTTATLIEIGKYAYLRMLAFERSFGGTADTPPTPVGNTNNYASTRVFNGSMVRRYHCKITLKNESTNPIYLEVFQVAVSFHEALIWKTVWDAACPLTFNSTLGAVNGGEVGEKTIALGLVDQQTILDSKFLQRFIKKLGTVVVPATTAGVPAEIVVNSVPPKCRRSQTGMYWGLFFANEGKANNGDVSCRIVGEFNFDEVPGATRNVEYPG